MTADFDRSTVNPVGGDGEPDAAATAARDVFGELGVVVLGAQQDLEGRGHGP
jgi:hypothetical protein